MTDVANVSSVPDVLDSHKLLAAGMLDLGSVMVATGSRVTYIGMRSTWLIGNIAVNA